MRKIPLFQVMMLGVIPWLGCVLFAAMAQGQVKISELMASNTQSHPDVVDFEDYPDWIELENTGATAAALDGYFLSDDPAQPLKWAFPAGATIPANSRLVVWADGHDAGPGESHLRGYWPWRTFTTEAFHTNFSLAAAGESVLLTQAQGLGAVTLVQSASPAPTAPATAAVWSYLADGSNPGTNWRYGNFNDAAWPSGPAKLGYGDSGMATTVHYGSDPSNKYITTYFRHRFSVANPAAVASLNLRLLVDDGAVIFLNGVEILRKNLPAGEITNLTTALTFVDGANETSFTAFSIPPTTLVAGENVLAVEVHQHAVNSSDVSFDLGLSATTFTSTTALDSVTFGQQIDDVSLGRDPAAPGNWVSFEIPTPGALNGGATLPDLRQAGVKTTISLESGFFSSAESVTLSAPEGEIRYTLDGGTPGRTSALYSAPIPLGSSTLILRARVFAPGKPPGPVETRTYFRGESIGSVPIVSLVADPERLFGNRIGIYSNQHEPISSATYNLRDVFKGKDAPGTLELFEPGGAPGFRVNGGIRMGGENNWATHSQRAMNFALRGKYGDDAIHHDLFPGSGIPLHTGLTLREGGDAWNREMLRDCMWPRLAKGSMNVDTSDYRPSVVFINGQYWGLHDIRSRWDDQWFFEHHRANPADVDHLLYGHVDSSAVTLGVEQGNSDDWLDLQTFLKTADLTTAANWAFVEARIDVDCFIDFVVAESYGSNTSWLHNREFWRERKAGGKWRWFLPDMDQTFRTSQVSAGVLADMLVNDDVLLRLKTNAAFRNRLAQRYAAHVDSTFKPAKIISLIDTMAAEVDSEVARHIAKWSALGGMTTSGRATNIQGIKDFSTARSDNVHAEIQTQLGVAAPVTLTLALSAPQAGRVFIAGVPVDAGTIRLFPGIETALKAEAAPGFAFSGWTGLSGGAETTITLNGSAALTANFTSSGESVVGGTLASDTTFGPAGAVYTLSDDLIIPSGVNLTILPGVSIKMPANRHLRVQGTLTIQGTAELPVRMVGRDGARWGGISFENPSGPSALQHLIIRGATRGCDSVRFPSAISGLNATLVMDSVDIDDSEGPIFTRGGSTILRSSRLHTAYTGDCINVKGGYAETRDCIFIGGNAPDTDAIDYDGVTNGIIAGNSIYRFRGSNSDGVDIGEGAKNILIEGNRIYFNSDKGVSVGQASTVVVRRNLVVGCALGVAVKDSNSSAVVDQNTFVECDEGVAAYEKNFGNGGGTATVENTIFSKCPVANVTADALSSVSVGYSLSDTSPLVGTANRVADPLFVDPAVLNYQLQVGSPAIDAGNPSHAQDADFTRADIGALYIYAAADYPFTIGNTVVIEEILANSDAEPDWVELHNRTQSPVAIGGWFLSDSATNLMKYRIPAGTVLPAGGYVVFREDTHFGAASIDPGRITAFGLSDSGETLHLSSAVNDQLSDYQTKEEFGASMAGESLGNTYKPSTGTWNFVPLRTPSPGAPNTGPRVGPVVISEIHYEPSGHADSEFLELTNISADSVTLYDATKQAAWKFSDGIDYEFPSSAPVVLAAGEHLVLVRNTTRFNAAFTVPPGTRVIQWSAGKLDNGGEQLQLVRPAGLDGMNIRQFARVDRVNFDNAAPWPVEPAGTGTSLTKVAVAEYGNDSANWMAYPPTPGTSPGTSFANWISTSGVPAAQQSATADPDGDGRPNLLEYALGSSPGVFDMAPPFSLTRSAGMALLEYSFRTDTADSRVVIEYSEDLAPGTWRSVDTTALNLSAGRQLRQGTMPTHGLPRGFFRMAVQSGTQSAPGD